MLLLTACNGTSLKAMEHGDNILTDEIVKANLSVNKNHKDSQTVTYTSKTIPTSLTGYEIANVHYSYGFFDIRKENTSSYSYDYGVYSFFAEKVILEPRLSSTVNYEYDRVFGFTMNYRDTDDKYYIADGGGNVLYDSESYIYDYDMNYTVVDGTLYSILNVNTYSTYETIYHSYDNSGKATAVESIGEEPENVIPAGEYYRVKTYDFEKLGLNRYLTRFNDNSYILYNKDGTVVANIDIPYGASVNVIGKKLYYQISRDMGSNASKYDYINNGNYYTLETYVYDLSAEKVEPVEAKIAALFVASTAVYNKDGAPEYAAVSMYEILKNRALDSRKIYIMADDGKLHDDITLKPLSYDSMILSNGNIYSYNNRSLLNSNREPLVSFSDVNSLTFNDVNETIAGYTYGPSANQYLFLCNNEGKLIVPTNTYTYSYTALANNYYKLTRAKDSKQVLYNANNKTEVELADNTIISGDFLVKSTEKTGHLYDVTFTVVGESTPLKSFTNLSSYDPNLGSFNRYFYDGKFVMISATPSGFAATEYYKFTTTSFSANVIAKPSVAA